jgi:GNAT superfamily N-acetyltransferase
VTSLNIRPMGTGDLAAVDRVLAATDESVATSSGWPYLELVLSCGRVLVGEIDGTIVGFAGAVAAGSVTHVSDLFVDPDHQGQGIGRQLLSELLGDAWPRTTFSSPDPRALPLYIRNGLRPSWPGCYVEGPATALPDPGPDLVAVAIDAAEMTEAERALDGIDRACLHRHEAREAGSMHLAVRSGGTVVAAGHARDARKGPGRWLDRLVVARDVDPVGPVVAALRAAADPSRPVGACLPGPHPALAPLLARGFRIVAQDIYCESEPGLFDPTRSLPDPALL